MMRGINRQRIFEDTEDHYIFLQCLSSAQEQYSPQGAVYCWCKNRKDEWFAARDLLGGDNYYQQGTPLIQLYDYYLNGNEDNHDYAVVEAGKAAGRLLKEVLINDKRTFATQAGYTRMYRWTGAEAN